MQTGCSYKQERPVFYLHFSELLFANKKEGVYLCSMIFSNLQHDNHYQLRCNLERALEELEWWAAACYRLIPEYMHPDISNDKIKIINATPETGPQLFKEAHEFCGLMEQFIKKYAKPAN